MKDAIDVTIDIRSLINVPEVTSLINGAIFQTEKPSRRAHLSDIVINCSSITNNQDQVGRVNVAVYWPNLSNGLADQANLTRVGKVVARFLDSRQMDEFRAEIENDGGVIVKDADGSNFYNIRCVYRSIQDNYKNI